MENHILRQVEELINRKKSSRLCMSSGNSHCTESDYINGSVDDVSPEETFDAKAIYTELQDISKKLKEENDILNRREEDLTEREEILSVSQSSLQTVTELGVRHRIHDLQREHNEEVEKMDVLLKEKTKENRRLRENFETLKQANDVLKKELEQMHTAHGKLEKQSHSLQSRITNLQRKNDMAQRQRDSSVPATLSYSSINQSSDSVTMNKASKDASASKINKQLKATTTSVYDILSVMLDWVSEHRLRTAFIDQRIPQLDADLDKCVKCLPGLVDILRQLPVQCTTSIYLPCLQFIYWALLLIEQSQTQKSSLVSTLRRLGDELYKPRLTRLQENGEGDKRVEIRTFFRSSEIHIRFLSCLIILKTLSQADLLAHVFDTLRSDLKNDLCKELFLYYHATPTFLPFLRPINKGLLGAAVDIFLQMASDTPFLTDFLETCGNEAWFRSVAMAIRSPTIDAKSLEKLSIVLQKLSKIRSNRKYFEVYTIVTAIQELLRSLSPDHPFLIINLKSILINLST